MLRNLRRPSFGALHLWLAILSLALALRSASRLLPAPAPAADADADAARGASALAARGGRLAVVVGSGGAADALCRLARRNGEAAGGGQRGGCQPPRPLARALAGGSAAEQCAALSAAAPLSYLHLSLGLASEPHWDAGALYVLALPPPLTARLAAAESAAGEPGPASAAQLLAALQRCSEANASTVAGGDACADSPLLRLLLGPNAELPAVLGEAHLVAAAARLAHFDALLLPPPSAFEFEFESNAGGGLQAALPPVAQALGWRFWDVTEGDRRPGRVHASAGEEAGAARLAALAAEARAAPGREAEAALALLRRAAALDLRLLAAAREALRGARGGAGEERRRCGGEREEVSEAE